MAHEDRDRGEPLHTGAAEIGPPSPFLLEHVDLLPCGRTLDLACGRGRHALELAARGHRVVAVDLSAAALASPALAGTRIVRVRQDLDAPGFRPGAFDAIVVVSFLDRRLFSSFARWLRPGGVLLYETFLRAQAAIGHPRNPDYLLEPGELARRLAPHFRILHHAEGRTLATGTEAFRAGVVARRLD